MSRRKRDYIFFVLAKNGKKLDPALFLLHVSNIPEKTYNKLVLRHLFNAAKSCIALHWRDSRPPSVSLWLSKIKEVNKMENLLLSAQNMHEAYS